MNHLLLLCLFFSQISIAQKITLHPNAHAHNDYEHDRPLFDALQNGFLSVEADVHLYKWNEYYQTLLVGHDRVDSASKSLEQLYLKPLDSLVKVNKEAVYKGDIHTFYLMIDIKTNADTTYFALQELMKSYPKLKCYPSSPCPVKIFLSGNRPMNQVIRKYEGLALDGRPSDIGKGFSSDLMPVISDSYWNWSKWDGKKPAEPSEIEKIKELAQYIHTEGKKFRLWAIPDNPLVWKTLLSSGVDLINTDQLQSLNDFLTKSGH
jgi:hypothetical protein